MIPMVHTALGTMPEASFITIMAGGAALCIACGTLGVWLILNACERRPARRRRNRR